MAAFGKWDANGGGWVLAPANWTCPRTAEYGEFLRSHCLVESSILGHCFFPNEGCEQMGCKTVLEYPLGCDMARLRMLTYWSTADSVTAPILSIPNEVRDEDPDWRNCIGGINGVYDPPIALTPADALAKPTVPGAVPLSTSELAPVSSPKPTDPPVTVHPSEPSRTTQLPEDPKLGQFGSSASPSPDDPAVTSLPEGPKHTGSSEVDSLASAVPHGSDAPVFTSSQGKDESKHPTEPTESSDPAHAQQSGQIDKPLRPGPESSASTTSAGQPTDSQPWQETGQVPAPTSSNTASAGVPGALTGHKSDLTTNALSILLSALSSAESTRATQEQQTVSADPNDGRPAEINMIPQADPSDIVQSLTHDKMLPSIMQTAETSLAAIPNNEITMTTAQDGATATTTVRGGVPIVDTQTHSVNPNSDATVANELTTYPTDQASSLPTQTISYTASDHRVAASKAGNAVASEHGVQTATAVSGGTVSLDSQDFELQHGDSLMAVGMDAFTVLDIANSKPTDVVATLTNHGSTFTTDIKDDSVQPGVLGVATALPAGAKATIASYVYDVPAFEYMPVHSGHSPLSEPANAEPTSVLETMQSVEGFLASISGSDAGNEVVLHEESSTFTLNVGQETSVNGHTLSVVSDGRAVAVDGSRSISWPAQPTTQSSATDAVAHTKSSTLEVRTSDGMAMPTAGTGVKSAALGVRSDMLRSKLVPIWIIVLLGLHQVLF
jgi:hypothetical protein